MQEVLTSNQTKAQYLNVRGVFYLKGDSGTNRLYIYPSISQDLLNKALDFASDHDNITTDERNIIIHAKNSILIHKHLNWQKKGNTTFDVTMGSYDGAETCELVGSFLLSQLQDLNANVRLYRDDGLAITNATPRETESIKKEIYASP